MAVTTDTAIAKRYADEVWNARNLDAACDGDRMAETWTYAESLGLLQQLGLVTIGPAG